MKYKPIQNNQTIEIYESQKDLRINTSNQRVIQDPKHQFSPRIYKVIRSEKRLKITLLSISFSLMLISVIGFIFAYLKFFPFKSDTDKPLYGYLVLFGISAFVFFVSGCKNTIENVQWSHTVQRYRDSISSGDYTSYTTFHIVYRRITLKDINLLWILIFVLTYLGLFTLIIFGLYKSGTWEAGKVDGPIRINLEWRVWLDNSFGNTIFFCIINTSVMAGLIVFYVVIKLFDKKRLADISEFLGDKSVEIYDQIEKAKKDRNKMWLRIYVVVVVLTILLPIALILVAIYKGVLRRKKSK